MERTHTHATHPNEHVPIFFVGDDQKPPQTKVSAQRLAIPRAPHTITHNTEFQPCGNATHLYLVSSDIPTKKCIISVRDAPPPQPSWNSQSQKVTQSKAWLLAKSKKKKATHAQRTSTRRREERARYGKSQNDSKRNLRYRTHVHTPLLPTSVDSKISILQRYRFMEHLVGDALSLSLCDGQ